MRHASILFTLALALLHGPGPAPARAARQAAVPRPEADLRWHDARALSVEGKGWHETKGFYDRLPARAEGVVRAPLWNLSRNSAGLCVRFVTDAQAIHARWTLRLQDLALPHMPATGVSGLDLYVRTRTGWRWLAVGRAERWPTNDQKLIGNMSPGRREYMLYLPLYNGVESVHVGVPAGAALAAAPPRPRRDVRPIVFYGTSIVQGGVASRPGMAYPAILGRRLDRPTINLGFSGNGKTEPEVARLLSELDPAVYVLDSLPNLDPPEVAERVEHFVRIIRRSRPATPIVLVENIAYQNAPLETSRLRVFTEKNRALRAAFARLKSEGSGNVFYLPGGGLLGADGEATVDGTHPTDLGFTRMADALEPLLRRILN